MDNEKNIEVEVPPGATQAEIDAAAEKAAGDQAEKDLDDALGF